MVHGLVGCRVLILLKLYISLVEAIGDPLGRSGCPCELSDELHIRWTGIKENLKVQLSC